MRETEYKYAPAVHVAAFPPSGDGRDQLCARAAEVEPSHRGRPDRYGLTVTHAGNHARGVLPPERAEVPQQIVLELALSRTRLKIRCCKQNTTSFQLPVHALK